jgi:hypothetical protein
MRNLGAVDIDVRYLGLEVSDESDSGRLASVACIGLELETKHRNTVLARQQTNAKNCSPTFPVMVLNSVSMTLFENRLF